LLQEIHWEIKDDDIDDTFLNENKDTIICIPLLDKLLKEKDTFIPDNQKEIKDALTGEIVIDTTKYKINEYDLWAKYIGQLPNINIKYSE
jgi:hypothetical protein